MMMRQIETRLRRLEAALQEEKEKQFIVTKAQVDGDISDEIRAEVQELEAQGIDVTLIIIRYVDADIALRNIHQSH